MCIHSNLDTLGDDEASVLIHAYLYKPPRMIKATFFNQRVDSAFYLRPDVCSGDSRH